MDGAEMNRSDSRVSSKAESALDGYLKGNKLPTCLEQIKDQLVRFEEPRLCGVYFVCDGDEVFYVGQSVHIGQRLKNHLYWILRDCKSPVVFYIPCQPQDLDHVERMWIKRLQPRNNSMHTNHGMAGNRDSWAADDARAAAMLRAMKD
jgi:hypothetical protein